MDTHPLPESVQSFTQLFVAVAFGPGFAKDHDIDGPQGIPMMSKRFPDQAFDPVALRGEPHVAFRHGHAQSRVMRRVRGMMAPKSGKRRFRDPACARENLLVIAGAGQPGGAGESPVCGPAGWPGQVIRDRDGRDPWRGAQPALCGRHGSPCGHGNRGCACDADYWAGMFFS